VVGTPLGEALGKKVRGEGEAMRELGVLLQVRVGAPELQTRATMMIWTDWIGTERNGWPSNRPQ
jgi:hypothetical protein